MHWLAKDPENYSDQIQTSFASEVVGGTETALVWKTYP